MAVEVALTLVSSTAGVPDPERCARVASWVWAGEETGRTRMCREQLLASAAEVMAVALGQAAALKAGLVGEEASSWTPVEAAARVGAAVRQHTLAPLLSFSQFHLRRSPSGVGGAASVPGSPSGRSRRSAGLGGRGTILQGAPPPSLGSAGASPRQSPPRRKRPRTFDEEVDALTPGTLRAVAKRLYAERSAAERGSSAPSAPAGAAGGGLSVREGGPSPAAGAAGGQSPVSRLASLSPFAPDAAAAFSEGGPSGRGGERPPGGDAFIGVELGGSSESAAAGVTLREADVAHGGALAPFFPREAGGLDVTCWAAQLASAGFPAAQDHFMRASGAAALGVAPGEDLVLAAELMAAHVAAMVGDLLARQALPARLVVTADSVVRDWREAARNARTLLSAYSVCFREKKGPAAAEAVAEAGAGGERARERPPPDSFEVVELASRAADRQLAVSADMLQGVTSLAALRREHARESSFKDLASSSQARRDREIAGELQYFVSQYGQEAAAYLVSNGMSVGRVRGAGVPTSLAGARGHLERYARAWVDSVFGRERAADGQYAADAHRLSLSVLTGVVAGDGPEAAEAVIVRLLGGSKPNELADIRREGGGVSDGTLGSLTGEAAHFSVRTAYHLWAQGVALCLGRVLVAASADMEGGESAVLGAGRDFDVQSNLLKIPHTLSNAGLRSTCRHFPRRLAFAMQAFRAQPGAQLPQVRAIAAETGGPVLEKRIQDTEYERTSALQLDVLKAGFEERVRSLESRLARAKSAAAVAQRGAAGEEPRRGRSRWGPRASEGPAEQVPAPAPAAVPLALVPGGPTGVRAPPPSGGRQGPLPRGEGGKIMSRLQAVRELQVAVRTRLGLDPDKSHGTAEPCAWAAIGGSCTKPDCQPCAGRLKTPGDLLKVVKEKCHERVLRVKRPKEPG